MANNEETIIRYTNAPEAYDYSYVTTLETYEDGWRKIEVRDAYRFENFQKHRYYSGMFQVTETI